jgi:DNA-binding response OmpR family regulator
MRIEDALSDPEPLPERQLKLSKQRSKIYGMLKRAAARNPNGFVTKQTLHNAVYGMDGDGPGIKILDVQLHHIRKKLPPGERIETVWGQGYRWVAVGTSAS